jgi:serine/threonine-protein kinase
VTPLTPLNIDTETCPGYRLIRLVGRGGFADVWEAQREDGRHVALKFMGADDRATAAKEIRSIRTICQLRHPHLVRIDNVWSQRNRIVIAMELAEASLQDLLILSLTEFEEPLEGQYVCQLLTQAAEGLDFLNARQHLVGERRVGIQHGDVKPSNLLLFGDTVKLADFGLSSWTTSSLQPHRRGGTPDFTAPEVFQGRRSDWTDQFALAVTYCMLRTGRLPYSDTPVRLEHNYVRPNPYLDMLPEGERPIIARALDRCPEQRWPSCREMMAHLARAILAGPAALRRAVSVTHP